MNATERLLADSKDIWDQYYTHPFILGLQNGDLDPFLHSAGLSVSRGVCQGFRGGRGQGKIA